MENARMSLTDLFKKYRILLINFSYLSFLQVFNLIIPLISYPYLIRILGAEKYGLVVFAQAVASYFIMFVGYGFNLQGTIDVSRNRDNVEKINEIVSSITILKAVFFLLSLLIYYIVLENLSEAKGNYSLFYYSLWFCLYEIVFPGWYFQGIEQMKWVAWITLVMRIVSTSLIFIIINSQNDYILVPLLNGAGALCAGVLSLIIIFGMHGLRLRLQGISTLKYYLIAPFPIFFSNISTSIMAATTKIYIGLNYGLIETAFYDLGEKILNLIKLPQQIFNQIVMPKISTENDINFIYKIIDYSFAIHVIMYVIIFTCANDVVSLIGGGHLEPASDIVRILCLSLPFSALTSVYGVLILIPRGYGGLYSKIMLTTTIIYIAVIVGINVFFKLTFVSLAIMTVIVEVLLLISMHLCVKRIFLK